MKAFAYARYRHGDQAGVEIAAQLQTIRSYCERHTLQLTELFVDEAGVHSMPWLERPAGQQLTARLEQGIHVVTSGGAIYTSASDLLAVVKDWQERGIVLHFAGAKGFERDSLSSAGETGNVMVPALEAFIAFKTCCHREAVRLGLEAKKRKNKRYCRHAGYGHRWWRDRRVPDQSEQATIAQIIALREAGRSWHKIASDLMRQRILTPDGREWSAARCRRVYAELQRRATENAPDKTS